MITLYELELVFTLLMDQNHMRSFFIVFFEGTFMLLIRVCKILLPQLQILATLTVLFVHKYFSLHILAIFPILRFLVFLQSSHFTIKKWVHDKLFNEVCHMLTEKKLTCKSLPPQYNLLPRELNPGPGVLLEPC